VTTPEPRFESAGAREAFGLQPGLTFLNHGSFGAVPRAVLAAQDALRQELEADPVAMFESLDERLAAVRAEAARRLGADVVALVDNTTTGVSSVLRSLRFEPGDRIVLTDHTYGAVWMAAADVAQRTGAVLDVAPVPFPIAGPEQVIDALLPRLEGARLVIIDAITSASGLVMPYAEVVAACRARGVPVLVDMAHAPGQLALDLDALGADFATGNFHKWMFAARGSAFLYVAPRWRELIKPTVVSWGWPRGYPGAFDVLGTRDPTAWLALPAAFAFLDRLGEAAQREHNRALARAMGERLAQGLGVALPSPAAMRANLVTAPLPGVPAERAVEVHRALRARGVQVPVMPLFGQAWVRTSAQVYNHVGEVDRLVEALADVLHG
jgi:isopenicillin-N epimerase